MNSTHKIQRKPFSKTQLKQQRKETVKQFRIRALILALIACPVYTYAACTDNLDGTFTCAGSSSNTDISGGNLTGATTLDNSSGSVTLTNDAGGIIANDPTAATVGETSTVHTNGNSAATVTNVGTIFVDRSFIFVDPTQFTADPVTGALLNNGIAAGVAAAISSDANTTSLTVNNNYVSDGFGGFILGFIYGGDPNTFAASDFSSAIHSSASVLTINNNSYIQNVGFSFGADTLTEGHWAISSYGTGTTILNNTGTIMGDILMVDRNPLMTAAQLLSIQRSDPALILAYGANDIGIRDSNIVNAQVDPLSPAGLAQIQGNIYLGSGIHNITNAGTGIISGNIYVDQSDVSTTDALGNVLTTVSGGKQLTLNNNGTFNGTDITINDAAGAVNSITFNAGLSADLLTGTGSPPAVTPNINVLNGLGDTTVNLNCFSGTQTITSDRCGTFGSMTNVSTVNVMGTRWDLSGAMQVIGDININAADVTNSGSLTANNVIVSSGTTLKSSIGDQTDPFGSINANLINNGTINLRAGTLDVGGNASFNGGSKLLTTIIPGAYGNVTVGGTGTIDSNALVVPTVSGASVHNGDSFTIATNTTGNPLVQNGTGLLQWTTSDATGNLVLTPHLGIPSFLTSSVSDAATNVTNLLVNYTGSNTDLLKIESELVNLQGIEVKRNVERLRPEIHDGAFRMVQGNTDRVLGIVDTRLLESHFTSQRVDVGANKTGISSGDKVLNGKGIWVQGFGYGGTQDSGKVYDGYSSSATGMAFGADRLFGDSQSLRIGGVFSYARGNVDNSGFTDVDRININSYLVAAYSSLAMDDWYINSALGVGRNTYDSSRQALGRIAEGSHDSWLVTAKVDAGWPLALNEDITFVPVASLNYSRIDESAYAEKGSIIALKLDDRTTNSLRSGLGGKMLYSIQQEDWNAALELRALYNHEFGKTAQGSTAQFVVGGDSFSSPGMKPIRDGVVLGGSVRLTGDEENDQISLLASYDADLRDKYFGQSLSMTLRYDFDQGPSYQKRAKYIKAAMQAKVNTAASAKATDRDIAAISQAMAPSVAANNPEEAKTQQAIGAALDNWIKAQANKNVDVYFNSYAAEFTAPDGSGRQAWERKRKTELTQEGNPTIKISYLTIKPEGNQASAVFTQTSSVGNNKDVILKSIKLVEKKGQWLIVREDGMTVPE